MPLTGIFRACLASAFLAAAVYAQPATLTYLATHPCCIAPDGHGNNFVVGSGSPAAPAISVVKLDASGTIASTFSFAAGPNDNPAAAAVDPQGNLWIACSPPHGSGSVIPMPALIVKLDPTGGATVAQYRYGGAAKGETGVNGIAFDPAGNVYLGGFTDQPDFPSTPPNASQSGFIAKLTPDFQPIYNFILGGHLPDGAITDVSAIAVDPSGIVTAAGTSDAADFPTTSGAFQTQCQCRNFNTNAFVTRINAQGKALLWSTLLGGASAPSTPSLTLSGLALDLAGNVMVTGTTSQPDFPVTAGVLQSHIARPVATTGVAAQSFNGFVSKLDPTGSSLLFSTYYGLLSHVSAPLVDSQGNLWITASPSDPSLVPLSPNSLATGDSLIAELSPDASRLLFSELLPNGVAGQSLALNPDGSMTAAGIIPAPRSLSGTAVRLPARTPAPVSVLGIADNAVNSVTGVIAPGEYLSFYGTGLGPDAHVNFDGVPATVLYSSATQINAIAPDEIASTSSTSVRVVTPAGVSQPIDLQVVPSHPNVFVVLNDDGTLNAPGTPAKLGSIVSIVTSGAGLPDSLPPVQVTFTYSYFVPFSLQFGRQTVPATAIDLPQIDVQVPAGLPSQATAVTLSVQLGNSSSPEFPVYLAPTFRK